MSSPNLKKKKDKWREQILHKRSQTDGQNKKMFSIINQGITNYEYNEMPLYLEWPTLKCLIMWTAGILMHYWKWLLQVLRKTTG